MRRSRQWIPIGFVGSLLVMVCAAAWADPPPVEPPASAVSDAGTGADASPGAAKVPPPAGAGESGKAAKEPQEDEGGREEWLGQIFGWGMIPLWTCSIALVALIIERRRALRPERILDPAMVEQVAERVGRLELDGAQKVTEHSDTVVGRAWTQALHEFSLGGTTMIDTLTNSTVLAFKPLKRNLTALATLGVVSPLFGLLGTVVGMIIVFGRIAAAKAGGVDKSQLADGIGLALFTTAGGLIVAIPAILANRYFTARLTGVAEQAESAINRINYRYSHAVAEAQKQEDGKTPDRASTTE